MWSFCFSFFVCLSEFVSPVIQVNNSPPLSSFSYDKWLRKYRLLSFLFRKKKSLSFYGVLYLPSSLVSKRKLITSFLCNSTRIIPEFQWFLVKFLIPVCRHLFSACSLVEPVFKMYLFALLRSKWVHLWAKATSF